VLAIAAQVIVQQKGAGQGVSFPALKKDAQDGVVGARDFRIRFALLKDRRCLA
jgi:hypothetical protein